MEARGVNRVFCDPFTECNGMYIMHIYICKPSRDVTQQFLDFQHLQPNQVFHVPSYSVQFRSNRLFGNLGWASPGRYDLVSYISDLQSTDENATLLAFAGAFVGKAAASSGGGGCSLVLSAIFLHLHVGFSVIFFSIFTAIGFGCVITPFLRFCFPSFPV